jgi:hypothetical protein
MTWAGGVVGRCRERALYSERPQTRRFNLRASRHSYSCHATTEIIKNGKCHKYYTFVHLILVYHTFSTTSITSSVPSSISLSIASSASSVSTSIV